MPKKYFDSKMKDLLCHWVNYNICKLLNKYEVWSHCWYKIEFVTPFSFMHQASKSCLQFRQKSVWNRSRQCNNPTKSAKGESCARSSVESLSCNRFPCTGSTTRYQQNTFGSFCLMVMRPGWDPYYTTNFSATAQLC